MWHRLFFFFLLLYLLFNLPFVVFKQYRKQVYLYKNNAALEFVNENPGIKPLAHLTRNTKLHPLFLITNNLEDTQIAKFDRVYITDTVNTLHMVNNIPVYAYIGDTLRLKIGDGRDTLIEISKKNNLVYIQDRLRITIKGIPRKVYVIDTIQNFAPYHGALRRYFSEKPFLSFIALLPQKNIIYTSNKVIRGKHKFQPVVYTIGKNLIIIKNQQLYNPKGFFLAFRDTVLPVPIKSVTVVDIKPDTTIAYLIGNRKFPLFFVKDHMGFIASPEIDILARMHPNIFRDIMDEMLSLTSNPLVYAYPDRHLYRRGEVVTIKVLNIPLSSTCTVRRNKKEETIVPSLQNPLVYRFVPEISDTIIVIKCGQTQDTVRIMLNTASENILYDRDAFIKSIKSNSYLLKRPTMGKAFSSTLYYLLLLSTLIIIWILERKKAIHL